MEPPVQTSAIPPFSHVFIVIDTHSDLQAVQKWFAASSHDNYAKEHYDHSGCHNFVFVLIHVREISGT
jgi:hypothetical protein